MRFPTKLIDKVRERRFGLMLVGRADRACWCADVRLTRYRAHSTQLNIQPGYIVAIFSVQLLSKKYLMAYELSLQCVSKWEQWYQMKKLDMASNPQIVGFYLE